jgi:hypothetical protein
MSAVPRLKLAVRRVRSSVFRRILSAGGGLRIRLDHEGTTAELVAYLRNCNCTAAHLAPDVLEVASIAPADALAMVRAGRCYSCGEEIAPSLSELGSPRCHDCRDEGGSARLERLDRIKLEAYLRVWNELHPSDRITVLDDRIAASG